MARGLRQALSAKISAENLKGIYDSYDVIGDIAIVRLTEKTVNYSLEIAEAIMKIHKNVKTVLAQSGAVHGEFRLRRLKYVAGIEKTVTFHREYGCVFQVDIEKCYFSPRLHYERMRIARQVKDGEIVVNMFAGVGCFSIVIGKHSGVEKIYSIDVNPVAVQYMQSNVSMNGLFGKVISIRGDSKEVIETRLKHVADRVLMPLPEKALDYLPYALLSLKERGGWIHYYDFVHCGKDESPVAKVERKVAERLRDIGARFHFSSGRVVRSTGPNWYQVVLDVAIKPNLKV
ncbi:class I SAM-dependent methyltransferase family protein [Candidatus Bathyarchaeota archaeon]|nr:class I SAM-dependent methyltransferase family protein [Candidatus Bathyarchaeota archaeon]